MAGCYLHLSSFSHFAVPSSIVQITQDQNVTEGHNVTLMCNVSGIPLPMVSWMTPDSQHVSGYKCFGPKKAKLTNPLDAIIQSNCYKGP